MLKPERTFMKRNTKVAVSGIAGVALLASLAACGSAGGQEDDTIEIWYRPGSLPSAAVDGVEAQFPDVKIKLVETPDVDTKLTSALRSGSGVPDVAVALLSQYTNVTDKFADVNEYGFEDAAGDYLDWKLEMGQDEDGRQIGVPIDIGPFGFFYRADVFEQAGLPTDPDDVGELVADWDGYRSVAEKVKASTGSYLCDAPSAAYVAQRLQAGYYYATDDGQYAPDEQINRDAFLSAFGLGEAGLCLNVELWTPEWSAGIAQNQLTGWVGPSYVAASMTSAGGDGAGQWRVTTPPGGPASQFGSFLSVFESSNDPQTAVDIARWLTNAENQAAGYADDSLFPSTPASYDMPEMTEPDEFYGGQVPAEVLGQVAEASPRLVIIPQSDKAAAAFGSVLDQTVASGGDAEEAYSSGLEQAEALG
ncbi:extracellular solute-binding protein [Georgenia sp. TF02-10]|uniref:ABC transporter substrate-binding protein n=1 Tax=Georgenia sp. TF02-10 TaxID=2917725 RepID=UPI001FA7F2C8|nr:extracellular solute-binding protein [Georgenia sp. TF02-10]UNX54029.1 extracellular solute-binding protein [Georgenia sp. TF02-10]